MAGFRYTDRSDPIRVVVGFVDDDGVRELGLHQPDPDAPEQASAAVWHAGTLYGPARPSECTDAAGRLDRSRGVACTSWDRPTRRVDRRLPFDALLELLNDAPGTGDRRATQDDCAAGFALGAPRET